MENNTMQYSEELEKLEKLDLETWLYLYLTKAKIKKHLKIENLSKKTLKISFSIQNIEIESQKHSITYIISF